MFPPFVIIMTVGGDFMLKFFGKLYEKALKTSQRRKGDFMCAKLDELRGISAEEILEESGQENAVPVDLDKIVETLGIYKAARDFSDIEKIESDGKISGLVILIKDDVKIYFNINDNLAEKRFTAAHEIGHCCLHGETLKNDYIEFLHKDGFENRHESEASIFASRLLIPKRSLFDVYNKLIKPTVSDLARIFQVPNKLMKVRLREEGLKAQD